jgi:hypothetical protein
VKLQQVDFKPRDPSYDDMGSPLFLMNNPNTSRPNTANAVATEV